MNNRRQTLIKYVVPAMLTNVSYFLFTIVDGLFAFWQVVDMILLSEKTVLCIASFLRMWYPVRNASKNDRG